MTHAFHKPAHRWAIFLAWTTLAAVDTARGQAPDSVQLGVPDAVMLGTAAGLVAAVHLGGIGPDAVACLPCATNELPGFDRWTVTPPRSGWSTASLLIGLGMAGWVAVRDRRAPARVAAAAEAASMAAGIAYFVQHAVGRHRPVLYTASAVALDDPAAERSSWPSGHTAAAFALASAMWWHAGSREGPAPWIALGLASAVGASRVIAGRHFPSDVLSGAVLGIGVSWLVHRIRF